MATVLFANKGFTNTSMTEVASMADIAGATIFYHFKTKEDLFVSVLESVKTGIVQEFSLYLPGRTVRLGPRDAARGYRLPSPSRRRPRKNGFFSCAAIIPMNWRR